MCFTVIQINDLFFWLFFANLMLTKCANWLSDVLQFDFKLSYKLKGETNELKMNNQIPLNIYITFKLVLIGTMDCLHIALNFLYCLFRRLFFPKNPKPIRTFAFNSLQWSTHNVLPGRNSLLSTLHFESFHIDVLCNLYFCFWIFFHCRFASQVRWNSSIRMCTIW